MPAYFFYVRRTFVKGYVDINLVGKSRKLIQSNGGSCRYAFLFSLSLTTKAKERRKYLKRYWVREIFQNRFPLGEYHTLVKEMRENDHESTSATSPQAFSFTTAFLYFWSVVFYNAGNFRSASITSGYTFECFPFSRCFKTKWPPHAETHQECHWFQ